MRVSTIVTGAIFVATGVIVCMPALAGATIAPSLSISGGAGPVGSVVTVTFSSAAGNGCGPVEFGPAKMAGGGTILPYIGNRGSQRFVIPGVLGSPNSPRERP